MTTRESVTLLHLSDVQFGRNHRFGRLQADPDEQFNTLLVRLTDDLRSLRDQFDLRPDLVVLSGDLAEWARPKEFDDVLQFVVGLCGFLELDRERVVLVPGNHDVNRKACEAHFNQCEADDEEPQPPYWPKWQHYSRLFSAFYAECPGATFTGTTPWSLFEMPEIPLVVAGLNSTIRESHKPEDHYGWVGEGQLRWFAERLASYRERGWLRIGVLHHNLERGAVADEENLRDRDDLKKYLSGSLNLVFHGHTHQGRLGWLSQAVPIVATGSAALKEGERPDEVPNQYQVVRIQRDVLERWGRLYDPSSKQWIGDTRISEGGNDLRDRQRVEFVSVGGTLGAPVAQKPVQSPVAPGSGPSVLKPGPAGPDPNLLRRTYLEHVYHQCGALSLAGVDRHAAGDPQAYLDLQAIYTGLWTLASDGEDGGERLKHGQPGAGEVARYSADDLARSSMDKRPLSALALLDRHNRLVLLGDPGSGKSTFVNFVAVCMAGQLLGEKSANLDRLTEPLPGAQSGEDDALPNPHPKKGCSDGSRQPWSRDALIPVRVVLRDFVAWGGGGGETGHADDLWRFVFQDLKEAGLEDFGRHLKSEVMEHGGLLLLDGFDEVAEADARRESIRKVVCDFAETYLRCRVLVTCRTYAYQNQEWRLPRPFRDAVLAPFDDAQIGCFVERWYAHVAQVRRWTQADSRGRAEVLKRAVLSQGRLRALGERPLLLTLMASLHAWRGGILPEGQEELYHDATDLLLDWWESQRVKRDGTGKVIPLQPSLVEWLGADRKRIREQIDRLAFEAHREQRDLVGTADIPEEKLVSALFKVSRNPDVRHGQLVEFLTHRAGLLVPRGVGVYAFPHRTFQEYLAACWLTEHGFPDDLAELVRKSPERWREVVLLAGAKAARGTPAATWLLVDALCFRDLQEPGEELADLWGALLAGQILAECTSLSNVRERDRRKLDLVRGWLVRVMRSTLPAVERAAAGRTLGLIGDPRRDVLLPEETTFCLVPAGPYWMGRLKIDDEMAYPNESPAGLYDLPYAYRVAKYPVTNAQFRVFMEAVGYGERRWWGEAEQAGVWREGWVKGAADRLGRQGPQDHGMPFALPNHPVVGVTWYESLAYTRWLEEVLRQRGLLADGERVTLPNEPEWEKAARGSEGDRRYPWGADPDADLANYNETGLGTTSAVGCFPGGASPHGIEDLAGNVWEWTRSSWDDRTYLGSPSTWEEREELAAGRGRGRVRRGGAFSYVPWYVRCAYRCYDFPSHRGDNLGFRVVVSPSSR